MDKADILRWSRRYDKDYAAWSQREQELGAKLRRTKVMTREELAQIVEWKFKDDERKKAKVLDAVSKNEDDIVVKISTQAFCVPGEEDAYRMNSLMMLNGVSPVVASVILAFFDPKRYGVFDTAVWRALLGNEPPNLFSTQNYLKLLAVLRKTSAKYNLDARIVEKGLFKKSLDEA